MVMIKCVIFGCKSTIDDDDRLFYPFPKNETRCSAWVDAIGLPELYGMTAQQLHEDYRVCDLHFIFLDDNKILLDDAVPCLTKPRETDIQDYTENVTVKEEVVPSESEPQDCGLNDKIETMEYDLKEESLEFVVEPVEYNFKENIEPQKYGSKDNIALYRFANEMELDDERNKSTQTDFCCINEGTQTVQTFLKTSEIACQTESEGVYDSRKVGNPLKRKLFKSLGLNNKVPKCEVQRTVSDKASCGTKQTTYCKDSVVSLMCQPDISFEMSDDDNNKTKNINSKKAHPKRSCRARKRNAKSKSALKRKQMENSSENESDIDNDPGMKRLDDAIKLVQQQWKLYGPTFQNDQIEKTKTVPVPVHFSHVNQGRYCSNELKYIALYLYYSNLTIYNTLRQPLNLTSDKTLRKAKVGVSTKLTPTAKKCLELKVSKLNENEKFCMMCADMFPMNPGVHKYSDTGKTIGYHEINEVQSTELATQALVVLVKGLYSDWIQPLTSCYLKENFDFSEVNLWLDQIIESLIEIGLKVVCFTTNESPGLPMMAKERGVSIERPYFFVNSHRVYYVFDIHYTMMALRNLFYNMSHVSFIDVDGTQQNATWFDIEKVFLTDQKRECKLAPELTEKHIINYLEREKNGFQLAVETFNKTVATGIVTCIEEKHLPEKSYGTVKIVELINSVFDILNSRDDKDLINSKDQMEVLERMLHIVKSSKIIAKNQKDKTASKETLRCLGITIRSILCIASDQKTEGFDSLCPRNLTLETLYEFFEPMKKQIGNKTNAVLFNAAFRRYYIENIIEPTQSKDSCRLDKDLIAIMIESSRDSSK